MTSIIVIAHNIRSCHNVGSLLRTSEGLGITKVFLSGYTPYPLRKHDTRLPYIAEKNHKAIAKTALGAEDSNIWEYVENISTILETLSNQDFALCALEQTKNSIALPSFIAPDKVAVVLGSEIEGINQEILEKCKIHLEIPMFGNKESFNVIEAATMAMYQCRFNPAKSFQAIAFSS